MDLVVWGWSDIVRRRVLEAARRISGIERIYLVVDSEVREFSNAEALEHGSEVSSLDSLGPILEFLDREEKGVVYVSGINAVHGQRSIAALRAGWHVAVDKPAFLSISEFESASALACERSLVLREALVWGYHEQVQQLTHILRNEDLIPEVIQGSFCIPGFEADNFRNSPLYAGGACWDLGPYAVTAARILGLDGFMIDRAVSTPIQGDSSVDLGFVLIARVGTQSTFVGTFSHRGAYLNRLTVLGRDFRAELSPVFSTKAGSSTTVEFEVGGKDRSFHVQSSDSFQNFLQNFMIAVDSQDAISGLSLLRESTSHLLQLRQSLGLN